MNIELVPALIQQFRETMEGDVGTSWITDGKVDSGVLGLIATISPEQAFAAPAAGHRSIAEHVEHIRFALALTDERLQGLDPQADWGSSFDIADRTAAGWTNQQRELRETYDKVLARFSQWKSTPAQDWTPINLAGLTAMTAHNAYHLGSIRQIAIAVRQ